MNRRINYIFYVLFAISLATCKTPYTPAPITANNSYLVVEGLINITDSTYINLSRSVNIAAKSTVKPELKATVTIESNQGNSYPLKELGKGVYAAAPLNLSAANQYRLRIKTTAGSTYVSDFTPTMVSPPIDSISWKPTNTALKIYANTHDPNNATHYYRWDYNEEWIFHTDYDSFFVSDGLVVNFRDPAKHVYQCFGGDTSHVITLGTSAGLSRDAISQQVVNTISSDAEKIGIKYSILVKQYALTKDAYDYWTLLKTNTEQLGSIFDAQPSASIGNIHGVTNPAEVVIGYISAGTIGTQRIFITKNQLPNWVTTPAYPISFSPPMCELDTIQRDELMPPIPWQNQYFNYKAPQFIGPQFLVIPVDALSTWSIVPHKDPIAWTGAAPYCVDCTLRGSTNQPAYWK